MQEGETASDGSPFVSLGLSRESGYNTDRYDVLASSGGGERTRTAILPRARRALSRSSYTPKMSSERQYTVHIMAINRAADGVSTHAGSPI